MEMVSSLFLIFTLLAASLSGGGGRLSDFVNTEMYWERLGVAYEVDALSEFLENESVDPDEVHTLIEQLGADRFVDREAAGRALLKTGDAAGKALTDALGSPDPEVAMRAKTILESLPDDNPEQKRVQQWMALLSLSRMEDPAAVAVLENLAAGEEGPLQSHAARMLSRTQSGESSTPLQNQQRLMARLPSGTAGLVQATPGDGLPAVRTYVLESGLWQEELISLILRAGDIRFQRVTAGIDRDFLVNPREGGLWALLEGGYDPDQLSRFLTDHAFNGSEVEEGVLFQKDSFAVLFAGPDALWVSLRKEEAEKQVLSMVREAPADEPTVEKDFEDHVREMNSNSPLWGFARLPGALVSKVEALTGLRTAGIHTSWEQTGLRIQMELAAADGEASEAVRAYAVSQVNESIQMLREETSIDVKPFLDVLTSIEVKVEGASVRLVGFLSAEALLAWAELSEQGMQRQQMNRQRIRAARKALIQIERGR
ncbi:MAG: hypothetical protein WD708_03510 [Kiritimatiellia bacterium]